MIEEIDFETYLSISDDKFEIFLFDKKNLTNLYKNELKFEKKLNFINFNDLFKFLDNNIFKIEKLAGIFIKNIFLIIQSDENLNLNICIKKRNYDDTINVENLEIILTEAKDLFKENYQEQNILHMVIEKYIINGKNYTSFTSELNSDHLCLEINFISIPNKLMFDFDKVLEKYQIKISQYLNKNYIKNFYKDCDLELSEMAYKLRNGCNNNEVILVPKTIDNKGFFEKFFQLFS